MLMKVKKRGMRYRSMRNRVRDFQCVEITDAATPTRDPTGTLDIRKRYRGLLELRWRKIIVQLRDVVLKQDMLGLAPGSTPTALSLSMAALPDDGVLRSFQGWLDNALNRVVLEADAAYLDPMIEASYQRALKRAMRLTKNNAVPPGMRDTIAAMQQLTLMELQGIVEALSQRLVRLASLAKIDSAAPVALLRDMILAVQQIGVTRGRAMIESMVVKAHATASLDQFEAAGIQHVGLMPEVVRRVARVGDAKPVQPAPARGTRSEVPSARTIARIRKEEAHVAKKLDLVEVLTAGDDVVCPDCEELSADGPYTIIQARGLIPAHPHCRCAFVPEGSSLFAFLPTL